MRQRRIVAYILFSILFISFLMPTVYSQNEYGRVYCKSTETVKKVALTFDDGPHPRYTEKILDILSEYGVKATFFIIGKNAENYPEAMKKIAETDCEIGNHTYSHARLDRLNRKDAENEIKKCEDIIYSVTGKRPSVLRPPHGFVSENFSDIASSMQYNVVLWSIDTLDWSLTPSDTIYTNVMKDLKGGDIILMHDYVSGGNTTCDALRKIIPRLLSEGYEFVTISELISE